MRRAILILFSILFFSCSKEESKSTAIDYPIKFTVDATPNNYEYVNKVSENIISANFKSLTKAASGSNNNDAYFCQASITSDFTSVKADSYVKVFDIEPKTQELKLTITKNQFPFQGIIYFRVYRSGKSLETREYSETRQVKVNWN